MKGARAQQPSSPGDATSAALVKALQVTTALCFLGHGSFGLIGKAAWIPYFTCVGISEATAWRWMPIVGLHDITLGLLLLWRPRRALLVWMTAWCVWTACLRPLAGEPFWEAIERAGNFGPPLALLVLADPFAFSRAGLFARLEVNADRAALLRCERVMRWALALLLLGHAALAFPVEKPLLARHLATLGVTQSHAWLLWQSLLEVGLAVSVLFEGLGIPVLVAALVWKLFTESLHLGAGPPTQIFEVIERWGDYGLPVALIILHRLKRSF